MKRSEKCLAVLGLLLSLLPLAGCEPATPETISAANIIGRWELTSGVETEWFDLAANGSFTAEIDRDGFIATTLSQGPHVSVEGTWALRDSTMVFDLTSSSEPAL